MKDLTLKPRISEKAYGQSQSLNVYVFTVPTTANKLTVKQAVSEQFGVTVETVNIAVAKGKQVRTIRLGNRRTRAGNGRRALSKKAYVTLKAGDSISVFDEPEAPKETKAKKTKKTTAETK